LRDIYSISEMIVARCDFDGDELRDCPKMGDTKANIYQRTSPGQTAERFP
jgi:hypothetical protein